MQGWVCAYCQRELDPRDPKYVDHFRPKKGGYWWLAYLFHNFFLTCAACNTRKSNDFPIEAGSPRVTYETSDNLCDEARLLLDPTEDPIPEWLCVDVDLGGGSGGFVAVRLSDADCMASRRTRKTIELLDMNDVDHVQDRVRVINKLAKMHARGKHEKLRRRASRYRPHAGTARAFLEVNAPELLPDIADELLWFLDRLCTRLKRLAGVSSGKRSERSKRRIEEIAWTLAFLWRDPPAGVPADVESYLDAMECKRHVEPYYAKLG
jgi:uncharacterized protein (TIGR02646 family)